jgi:hypothetical protein
MLALAMEFSRIAVGADRPRPVRDWHDWFREMIGARLRDAPSELHGVPTV